MDVLAKLVTKWESIPTWIKLLMLVLFGSLEIVLYSYTGYLPRVKIIQSKFDEIDSLHKKLDENEEIASNLIIYQEENERLIQKLDRALMYLPKGIEGENLMRSFHKLSEKFGVSIGSFNIEKEIMKDFYAEIPISLKIEASYHEILTFFDQISKMERIINVSNVSFSSPKKKEGKIILAAEFRATTYRFIKGAGEQLEAPQKSVTPEIQESAPTTQKRGRSR